MQVGQRLRELFTRRPEEAARHAARNEGESTTERELRQSCLERLRSRGMPLWREEPETCDRCGRELLLGERALLLCRDDELLLACPLCADALRGAGYLSVTADDGDAAAARAAAGEGPAPRDAPASESTPARPRPPAAVSGSRCPS